MEGIPPIERPEWKKILEGEYNFRNFAPRLLLDRLRKDYSAKICTAEECIDELHTFFEKYQKAYKPDLIDIFKDW